MKLRLVAAACAALMPLFSSPAMAGGEPIVARLQTPLSGGATLIAGGAMFVCQHDACIAASPASRTFGAATCKAIAARFGQIVAFSGSRALEPSRLADCNTRGTLARGRSEPSTRLAKH